MVSSNQKLRNWCVTQSATLIPVTHRSKLCKPGRVTFRGRAQKESRVAWNDLPLLAGLRWHKFPSSVRSVLRSATIKLPRLSWCIVSRRESGGAKVRIRRKRGAGDFSSSRPATTSSPRDPGRSRKEQWDLPRGLETRRECSIVFLHRACCYFCGALSRASINIGDDWADASSVPLAIDIPPKAYDTSDGRISLTMPAEQLMTLIEYLPCPLSAARGRVTARILPAQLTLCCSDVRGHSKHRGSKSTTLIFIPRIQSLGRNQFLSTTKAAQVIRTICL